MHQGLESGVHIPVIVTWNHAPQQEPRSFWELRLNSWVARWHFVVLVVFRVQGLVGL